MLRITCPACAARFRVERSEKCVCPGCGKKLLIPPRRHLPAPIPMGIPIQEAPPIAAPPVAPVPGNSSEPPRDQIIRAGVWLSLAVIFLGCLGLGTGVFTHKPPMLSEPDPQTDATRAVDALREWRRNNPNEPETGWEYLQRHRGTAPPVRDIGYQPWPSAYGQPTKTVHVSEHTTKAGVHVKEHIRAAPGTGSGKHH